MAPRRFPKSAFRRWRERESIPYFRLGRWRRGVHHTINFRQDLRLSLKECLAHLNVPSAYNLRTKLRPFKFESRKPFAVAILRNALSRLSLLLLCKPRAFTFALFAFPKPNDARIGHCDDPAPPTTREARPALRKGNRLI